MGASIIPTKKRWSIQDRIAPQLDQNAIITLNYFSIRTPEQVHRLGVPSYTSYPNVMGIPSGFGFVLLEGLVCTMLCGITTLQTYMYYMHYSEDALTTKFLVVSIWILDILHASFICHILYHYLITNYGVLTSLEHLVWSTPASLVVNLLVIAAVQCFFTYQIYYLCCPQVKWLVIAPIMLLVVTHFGFGMEIAVLIFVNNEFSTLSKITSYASLPCVATRVLAEVLITLSLCILVYDRGSRSVFPRTKRLLNTLIIYAINRCFLILLVTLAELVVIICNQDAWAMGFDINIGTLYANSLLASLNTRQYLRSRSSGPRSDLFNDAVHIVDPPKFSRDGKISKDGQRQLDLREVAVIDVAAVPVLDKTTGLRRKREV